MTYLTLEDLFAMVEEMLGTTRMDRDPGLLDASAYRPRATMSGDDFYPTVHLKAAALMESPVCNHALIDGNKRLAFAAAIVLYRLNGWRQQFPHRDAAVDLVLGVAQGEVELHRIAAVLESRATLSTPGPSSSGRSCPRLGVSPQRRQRP